MEVLQEQIAVREEALDFCNTQLSASQDAIKGYETERAKADEWRREHSEQNENHCGRAALSLWGF
jgi:chromosome segregation ATPase